MLFAVGGHGAIFEFDWNIFSRSMLLQVMHIDLIRPSDLALPKHITL
jgi:hypothetical protein